MFGIRQKARICFKLQRQWRKFLRFSHIDPSQDPRKVSRHELQDLLDSAASFDYLSDRTWSTTPYPHNILQSVNRKCPESRTTLKPHVGVESFSVLLFPGEGSQFVGMGKELVDFAGVDQMYDVVSEVLGYDLKHICFNGPKAKLDEVVNSHMATFVTSLAALQRLDAETPLAVENCVNAAGYGVGEYAALVFAEAMSFEAAVRIVKIRAEAIKAASEMASSGSAMVILRPEERLKEALRVAKDWCVQLGVENPCCEISSYRFHQCLTIAGNTEALEFVEMNAREFGIEKFRFIKGGSLHSSLMLPAEPILKAILSKIEIRKPLIDVVSCLDGKPFKDAGDVRKRLARQISSPLKWQQVMTAMYNRKQGLKFPKTYIVGPGKWLGQYLSSVNQLAYQVSKRVYV